jgi:hypothetical protein
MRNACHDTMRSDDVMRCEERRELNWALFDGLAQRDWRIKLPLAREGASPQLRIVWSPSVVKNKIG